MIETKGEFGYFAFCVLSQPPQNLGTENAKQRSFSLFGSKKMQNNALLNGESEYLTIVNCSLCRNEVYRKAKQKKMGF